MFQTLRGGSPYLTTVTSMTENEARFPVEGKSAKRGVVRKQTHLVDLPGHPRLRGMLDKHAQDARAVVFVVDAVDFTAQRRAVASISSPWSPTPSSSVDDSPCSSRATRARRSPRTPSSL